MQLSAGARFLIKSRQEPKNKCLCSFYFPTSSSLWCLQNIRSVSNVCYSFPVSCSRDNVNLCVPAVKAVNAASFIFMPQCKSRSFTLSFKSGTCKCRWDIRKKMMAGVRLWNLMKTIQKHLRTELSFILLHVTATTGVLLSIFVSANVIHLIPEINLLYNSRRLHQLHSITETKLKSRR